MRRTAIRVSTCFLLASAGPSCRSAQESLEPGAILLQVSLVPGTSTPEELRVTVFDESGPLWRDARVPAEGPLRPESAERLGSVLIHPGEAPGVLRVHVRALVAGARVAGGLLSVPPGERGVFAVALDPTLPADDDGDGVPDAIDDCQGHANPNQGGCPGDLPDAGVDAGSTDAADAGQDAAPCPLAEGCNKPNGVSCQDAAACASGFCADGVCCGAACDGRCRSCNQPGADGVCMGYGAGSDPEGECNGGATCNGAGACGAPPPPASKSNGELCGGAGECLSGFCKDGVCCNSACTDVCKSCSSGTCSSVTRGTDAPECIAPMHCNPAGRCVD